MTLMRFVVISGIAIALCATGAEAVMCVKKSGVVVRDACRTRETPTMDACDTNQRPLHARQNGATCYVAA